MRRTVVMEKFAYAWENATIYRRLGQLYKKGMIAPYENCSGQESPIFKRNFNETVWNKKRRLGGADVR